MERDVPMDVMRKIAREMEYPDIISLCRTNRNLKIFATRNSYGNF
jgi:hypothetical protein